MWRRKQKHEFTMPAQLNQLEMLGDTLDEFLQKAQDLPEPESDIYAIKLAVHELVTNIIRHAYANLNDGKIDLALALGKGEFSAVLSDSGHPFNPDGVAEPDLEHGQEGGYGVFLIEHLMDEVVYKPLASGNQWRLVKRW